MITEFKLVGDTAVIANFDKLEDREHDAVLKAIGTLGLDLLGLVDTNLSGEVLNRQVTDTPVAVGASVGFNKATAPYGVYHEFGVPHEWVITAKKAKALRFQVGGQFVFRKSVVHPPLPERSFLRSALKAIAPRVKPAVETALREANA